MIKIVHLNGDEKVVTKGAFESVFKPLGYKQVIEKKETIVESNKDKLTGKNEGKKDENPEDNKGEKNTSSDSLKSDKNKGK